MIMSHLGGKENMEQIGVFGAIYLPCKADAFLENMIGKYFLSLFG